MDEVKALLATSGVDLLAEKDTEGKTAQDLAAESDEMKEAICKYIKLSKTLCTLYANIFISIILCCIC